MASIQKSSKNYHIRFYDPNRKPKQKRFSLKVSSKRSAKRIKRKLEEAKAEGRYDPWTQDFESVLAEDKRAPEPLSFAEARQRFLKSREQRGCRRKTIEGYSEVLHMTKDWTATEAKRVVQDSSIAQATKGKRYGTLRVFFNWCKSGGHISKSPLGEVQKPKPHGKMPKAVSPKQLRAITSEMLKEYKRCRKKNWVNPREVIWRIPLFWFALYSGLRGSELARLEWSHVDFSGMTISIFRQKNRTESKIPLLDKAAEAIEGLSQESRFVFHCPGYGGDRKAESFVNNTSRAFRKYRKRAGLPNELSLHGLRHGFGSLLAQKGLPAVKIKKLMRHSDLATTLRYVHMHNNDLRNDANALLG